MRRVHFRCLALVLLAAAGPCPSARAWGCKGHQVVALLAEKHLNSRARLSVEQILAAGPIRPDLQRFCQDKGLDAFADSSTWADDERTVHPDTAGWHFIDIPRGVSGGDLETYCPQATGCVRNAIADQMKVLRNSDASAQARADALRYIIHFVADLHQPLHTTTNSDRGGNCVPLAFFGHEPEQTDPVKENYKPNLHGIWDTEIIERLAGGRTAQELADDLDQKFKIQISKWQSQPVDLTSWVWESHQIAEDVTYGDLPTRIAVEPPRQVNTCADNDHISKRMLSLHEQIRYPYERDAEVVVEESLAKAGARLAAIIDSLWPPDRS